MKLFMLIGGLTSVLCGCGKQPTATNKISLRTGNPVAITTPADGDDPYALLSLKLQYTTLLNQDTSAILRCTVEEMKEGTDRGPICREACTTGNALIKFEQDHPVVVQYTDGKPSKQHRWCKHKTD